MRMDDIYRPIEEDLIRVEEEIACRLKSGNKYLRPLMEYLLEGRGKFIRPSMLLLSFRAASLTSPKNGEEDTSIKGYRLPPGVISIASAVELIHTSTLLHDDVIDKGLMRRHKPTVNSKWGNRIAILMGDHLFSLAFTILADNNKIMEFMTGITSMMCQGEIVQDMREYDLDMSEDDYMKIIVDKSGLLFAASCRAGAMLAGANSQQQEALYQYGINFGVCYQILDDLQDIVGKEDEAGKSLGNDYKQKKITLPQIYLRDVYPDLAELPPWDNVSRVVERIKLKINEHARKAEEYLEVFEESDYRESLKAMLERFLIQKDEKELKNNEQISMA